MKSMRLIGSLSCIMLVMAISAVAQPSSSPAPVLDSAGRPLQRGVEYYINPAITDSGGRFTLINRNGSCPFYVGQENVSGLEGLPVIFTPFVEGETVIRENRDFRVAFSAATICVQSTAWKLGEKDPESNRRLIVTGEDQSSRRTANYFRIVVWELSIIAQPSSSPAPVLDSARRPLQRGVEYYINPAITDSGGRFTLINRNGSCPFYVGQENVSGLEGLPVIFTPFVEVAFSAATICVQSTAWKLGEKDPESNRRLIVTGEDQSSRRTANYFRIEKASDGGDIYQISWCPTDVCPTCRFDCGTAGNLVENGKRLLALDGNVIPVSIERRA
ncbi:kunitz trypsin inhibitor 2 [Quercus suber]|uniref:Kunitz trypsin inhibitor 2 n=1 Tax=Quercus suber TaxID=58331 RepID=A0AAW0KXG5_QUESU